MLAYMPYLAGEQSVAQKTVDIDAAKTILAVQHNRQFLFYPSSEGSGDQMRILISMSRNIT